MISDRVLILAAITITLTMTASVAAQTTGVSSSPPAPGIGLSAEHRRTIYREVGHETIRPIPEGQIAIGAEVPGSLMLSEMPVSVKDQIGLLRDFKFAKVAEETIIIVDPAKRQIVDVVTHDTR